ncbi:uncharacterized protein EV422DRAFT_405927 [Fimicolochytrium jonesii]|uniref:uncharacterized protein n=1 Tax=Fimicolochytrium jonesii TaxID=1396493 RepID=UPI0022FDCA40|nr:uncharacterized protein EV422DRAFT_405927 [Fimicolochytrium jonesii]KAI8822595.1 hypothetical protein EV422DRAFT_405927 [Fimicolochytrium jonesii]
MKTQAGLSIILGSAVVVTFLLIRKYQPALASRVSLRLAVVGVSCDICYGIAYLISCLPTGPSKLCDWSMFFTVLFLLCSLFLTASIGLNLLLVFVLKVQKDRHIERTCYFACGVMAVLVPSIGQGMGVFGWDGSECWYAYDKEVDPSYDKVFAWQWGTYYFWILSVSIFCTTCLILFALAARNPHKAQKSDAAILSSKDASVQKQFAKTDKLVRKAVGRIKWYCVVPLVAHFFSFFSDMYYRAYGINVMWAMDVANFMSAAMGALSATIFFTLDPSVAHAFKKLRTSFFQAYYFRFHVLSDAPGGLSRSNTAPRTLISTDHSVTRLQSVSGARLHFGGSKKGSDEENNPGPSPAPHALTTTPTLILRHPLPHTLPCYLARILVRDTDRAKYIKMQLDARKRASANMLGRTSAMPTSRPRVGPPVEDKHAESSTGLTSSFAEGTLRW